MVDEIKITTIFNIGLIAFEATHSFLWFYAKIELHSLFLTKSLKCKASNLDL